MLKEFMERGRRLCGRWCLIGRGEQVGRALDLHIGVVLHILARADTCEELGKSVTLQVSVSTAPSNGSRLNFLTSQP